MNTNFSRGFTAVEILTTIGIMAVISTLTVLVVNPVELFKQSRDAQRASDLAQIINALELANVARLPLGSANTVYVSVPQVGGVCPTLTPTLAIGYSYVCAADTTYKNVDSTGWIPVNFSQSLAANPEPLLAMAAQVGASPLVSLPVDPKNSADDSFFYAYLLSGKKYQLVTRFESVKYAEKMQNDGGTDDTAYEVGPTLDLWALATGGNYAFGGGGAAQGDITTGLVGHWKFDEVSGTSAADASGNGNTGTLVNNPTWISEQDGGALNFSNTLPNDYVDLTNQISLTGATLSVGFWFKASPVPFEIYNILAGKSAMFIAIYDQRVTVVPGNSSRMCGLGGTIITDAVWHHAVVVSDSAGHFVDGYLDGALDFHCQLDAGEFDPPATQGYIIAGDAGIPGISYNSYYGALDDLRIYNRALTAEDVTALYADGL